MANQPAPPDPIETALAEAVSKATAAEQWDVVASLAAELKARREDRGNVVHLAAERKRRGGL